MRSSDHLKAGNVYTREDLRKAFNIHDATLNTGVFRPPGHESVWLFVTEDKTADRTQYRDRLDGDDLRWDGQTAGRTDSMIINHVRHGLELLVFYRRKKYEHEGAGFRLEGSFQYVSHEGSGPAHFLLRRVNELSTTSTLDEVRAAIDVFNRDARTNEKLAKSILSSTDYWIYDPATDTFGPSKFVGFRGMTFSRYSQSRVGNSMGTKFDGHITRNAIVELLKGSFEADAGLGQRLQHWGLALLGDHAFGNVNPDKWRFVSLQAGGERAIDLTIAAAVETAIERVRGQGFSASPEARRAVEELAMRSATSHFEAEGYQVADVSRRQSYDLHCIKDNAVLRVEVKGTTTPGDEIILTPNEVALARDHFPATSLFILHSISVNGPEDAPVASEGVVRIIQPWSPTPENLRPTAYWCAIPFNLGQLD